MGDYVLVPRVATEAMLGACMLHVERWGQGYFGTPSQIHDAMLAARPPVDYDALAHSVYRTFQRLVQESEDSSEPYDPAQVMAQALREVMP